MCNHLQYTNNFPLYRAARAEKQQHRLVFIYGHYGFVLLQCFWAGVSSQPYLVVKEMHSVAVELQRQRLQEGDVVGHDLLIGEVELVHDDGVDVVIRQQVVCRQEKTNKQENVTLSGGKESGGRGGQVERRRLQRDVSWLMFSNRMLSVCRSCTHT